MTPNASSLHSRFCRNGKTGLLIMVLAILVLARPTLAQTTDAKPLNLGDAIQNTTSAPKARTYITLPKTIPIPANNPLKGGATAPVEEPAEDKTTQTILVPVGESSPGIAAQSPSTAFQSPSQQQHNEPQIQQDGIARLQLSALLTEDGQTLQRGVNWRIFGEKKDKEGRMPLMHNVDGGPLDVELKPGSYIIYAGYGYANLTKRILLPKAGLYREDFNLRAGAVRLNAVASGDVQLDSSILTFDVYSTTATDNDTHSLLVKNVKPDYVVKLTEGTYHIISSYGSANAKVRGDIVVTAGKLVNVTMIQNAAKVTLRLVSEPGGEALANTIWTVFTPGGDVVKRAIGAFPTLALAAGDYTAIAKQNDEVYNREFSVNTGLDREIEVLATTR